MKREECNLKIGQTLKSIRLCSVKYDHGMSLALIIYVQGIYSPVANWVRPIDIFGQ